MPSVFVHPMHTEIKTEEDYQQALLLVENYLAAESDALTATELAHLSHLSSVIEHYEDEHYPMPVTITA